MSYFFLSKNFTLFLGEVFGDRVWREAKNWMKEFIKTFCLVIFSKEIANFHVQFLAGIWGHKFGLQIPGLHICVGARLIDNSTSFTFGNFTIFELSNLSFSFPFLLSLCIYTFPYFLFSSLLPWLPWSFIPWCQTQT